MTAEHRDIETKLAAARTRLIIDKPFLGALVMRLPMQPANPGWCPTTATDARAFYYNPDYIQALNLAETQFMLAHEALHCALSHFARRQHRSKHKWDLACDYAINPLLIEDGLTPPPNALVMPLYRGLTAEEIYPLIGDNDQAETLDTHAYDQENQRGGQSSGMREQDLDHQREASADDTRHSDSSSASDPRPRQEFTPEFSGADQPPPLTPDERDMLAIQWQQRTAGAAQQALRAGKLRGDLARMIDHLLQPQLPWRMLLARYLSAISRDDYSYQRPSRREGPHIQPSLRSQQARIVVAIDTSGSIGEDELDAFIQEIDALKGQVRAHITLLPCDTDIDPGAPYDFAPWEDFRRPAQLQGGGGTHFQPVFEWVDRHRITPDLLLYFTDGKGDFPATEPPYPTIWLIKGREKVPWGERIQLNG